MTERKGIVLRCCHACYFIWERDFGNRFDNIYYLQVHDVWNKAFDEFLTDKEVVQFT
jgi:hypothetical protein